VFVFETYIEAKTVIAVQRRFSTQFNVKRHGNIPDRNTIMRWVEAFRATGSVMKRKPPDFPASVRMPENIERVSSRSQSGEFKREVATVHTEGRSSLDDFCLRGNSGINCIVLDLFTCN
jgi:hypothetical protein